MDCEEILCTAPWFHDLEVMSSSPDRAELGVRGTSVLSRT